MYQSSFIVDQYSKASEKTTPTPTDQSKLIYFNPMNTSNISSQVVKMEVQEKRRHFSSPLRTNFIIVFVPLMFWGFPSHLLFLRKRITSTTQWLKYLCPCSSPFTSILTVILAVYSIIVNAFALYIIGRFFYCLFFTAAVTTELVDLFLKMVRLIPVAVPLDMMWFQGYKLKNFMASFDRVVETWAPLDGNIHHPKISSGRLKLCILYAFIMCIHGLHYVIEYFGNDPKDNLQNVSIKEQVFSVVIEYSVSILFTLVIPVYCTFCWAVQYELQMNKEYIRSLIVSKVVPKYEHFNELKRICRKIGDDILTVNYTFSVLLSVVGVVLGLYVWGEAEHIGLTILHQLIAAYTGQQLEEEKLNPETVRIIIGDGFIILLYAVLLWITYWQAVMVNDEVRLLQVWLNDFVTEPESKLSSELHEAFTLLKWYIHSRMEQEKPALLSIMGLSLLPLPGLKTRLLQYKVIH